MALLSIDGLTVAYDKVEAVRGVSLAIEAGQIVTVIGPNGAGKTTLLNAAIGLLRWRGRMSFDGVDLRHLDVEGRDRARLLPRARDARAVRRALGRRQPPARRLFEAPRHGRAETDAGRCLSNASPGSPSDAASGLRRCRAASGRCWRWGAP